MKKSKFLKKSLAMLLAVMMVVAMIPLSASAAEAVAPTIYVDNQLAALAGTEYTVTAGKTTVDITTVPQKDVTLVAVDKSGVEIATLTGINLVDKATKEGDVYTLGLRTKTKQPDNDATTNVDYTLKVTVKATPASSDNTLKGLNTSIPNWTDSGIEYTIDNEKNVIHIVAKFGSPFNTFEKNLFIPNDPKATVEVTGTGAQTQITVTAADGSTRIYTVDVTAEAMVKSFTIPGQIGESVIEQSSAGLVSVTIQMPYTAETTVEAVPTFEVNEKYVEKVYTTSSGPDVLKPGDSFTFQYATGEKADKPYPKNTLGLKIKGNTTIQTLDVYVVKPLKNPEAALKTIQVGERTEGSNEITVSENVVKVEMPSKTDFSKPVKVKVSASENATVSIPAQNKTAQGDTISDVDISGKTFVVRVVSEDGKTTTDYTVNLEAAAGPEAKLVSFSVKADNYKGESKVWDATFTGLNGSLTLPYYYASHADELKVYAQFATGSTNDSTIINGTTTLDKLTFDQKTGVLKIKVTNEGLVQTYTLTRKFEAPLTGRSLVSAVLTSATKASELTKDNAFASVLGTATNKDGASVNTVKVTVPYSFDLENTKVNFSEFQVSEGAKVFVFDTASVAVKELMPLDPKDGAVTGVTGFDKLPSAEDVFAGDKLDTTKATAKLYVASEKNAEEAAKAADENKLAELTTMYYVYAEKAPAETGKNVVSIESSVDKNVSVQLKDSAITVTTPGSYKADKTFTLNFDLSKMGKLNTANDGSEKTLISDMGKADKQDASKFFVNDQGELVLKGAKDDGSDNVTLTTNKAGKLYVKAENGEVKAYTLNLVVNPLRTDALLTSVKVNNTFATIEGMNAVVVLPFGSKKFPVTLDLVASEMAMITIDGKPFDPEKSYDLSKDLAIKVTSEDEGTANIFTLKAQIAEQFNDVSENDWFYKNVMRAVELGILTGKGEGVFAPQDRITRRDFSIMLAQSLGNENNGKATSPFKDVADDDYGVVSIAFLYEKGIVTGDSNGNFNPDANITRQEAAIMLAKAFNAEGTSSELFKDDAKIANWAKSFVYAAKAAGLMKGDADGSFRPIDTITRAEAASAMVNAIDK